LTSPLHQNRRISHLPWNSQQPYPLGCGPTRPVRCHGRNDPPCPISPGSNDLKLSRPRNRVRAFHRSLAVSAADTRQISSSANVQAFASGSFAEDGDRRANASTIIRAVPVQTPLLSKARRITRSFERAEKKAARVLLSYGEDSQMRYSSLSKPTAVPLWIRSCKKSINGFPGE